MRDELLNMVTSARRLCGSPHPLAPRVRFMNAFPSRQPLRSSGWSQRHWCPPQSAETGLRRSYVGGCAAPESAIRSSRAKPLKQDPLAPGDAAHRRRDLLRAALALLRVHRWRSLATAPRGGIGNRPPVAPIVDAGALSAWQCIHGSAGSATSGDAGAVLEDSSSDLRLRRTAVGRDFSVSRAALVLRTVSRECSGTAASRPTRGRDAGEGVWRRIQAIQAANVALTLDSGAGMADRLCLS